MGLQALIEQSPDVDGWDPAGYIDAEEIPPDPWKNEYQYYYTGESARPFEIYSYGPDGEEGTEDDIYDTTITGDDEG